MLPLSYLFRIKNGEDSSKFSTCGCLHPFTYKVFNSTLGHTVEVVLPCGTCVNCQDQRRNEWVTRLTHHSMTHRYTYFVTLTYGNYNLFPFESHPFQHQWMQTFPFLTDNNFNKKHSWSPTLLRQEHLTTFFKRLRKHLGFPISYAACGEYGSTYSRPHFHLILFSDNPITKEDIIKSWSYDCYAKDKYNVVRYSGQPDEKYRFRFLIGKVDFHDLVANHTCDWHSEYNGQSDTKASSTFSYVAKYVGKNYIPKLEECENFERAYSLLRNKVYSHETISPLKYNHKLFNPYSYVFSKKVCVHNGQVFDKVDFLDFCKIYRPFFVTSRNPAIGSRYLTAHLQQFKEGNFALPPVQGRELTFPYYYLRKTYQDTYQVRFRKIGETYEVKSTFQPNLQPLKRNYSLVKFTLQTAYQHYREFRDMPRAFIRDIFCCAVAKRGYEKMWTLEPHSFNSSLLDCSFVSAKGTIHYAYQFSEDMFIGFRYDRKSRDYLPCDYVDRLEFCDLVMDSIEKQLSRKPLIKQSLRDSLELFHEIYDNPKTPIEVERYENLRDIMQKNYLSKHVDKQ